MANKGTSDPLTLIATFWNSVGRGSPDVRFTPVDEVRLLPKSVAISPGATDPAAKLAPLVMEAMVGTGVLLFERSTAATDA